MLLQKRPWWLRVGREVACNLLNSPPVSSLIYNCLIFIYFLDADELGIKTYSHIT